MKFLVDAQLPRRFCRWLSEAGHDALHTLDLPDANRTPDAVILDVAERDGRIVITKDDDFVQSHLVIGRPDRLVLVATGNIGNPELERLICGNLASIVRAIEAGRFIEIGREALTIHD